MVAAYPSTMACSSTTSTPPRRFFATPSCSLPSFPRRRFTNHPGQSHGLKTIPRLRSAGNEGDVGRTIVSCTVNARSAVTKPEVSGRIRRVTSGEPQPSATSGSIGVRTAAAGFAKLGSPDVVDLEFGYFTKAFFQAFQKPSVKAALGWDEGIVLPQATLANMDQASLPQVGQMLGNARLRGRENFNEVSHTQFPIEQDVENPESRPVREGPEHRVDTVESFDLFRFGHGEIQSPQGPRVGGQYGIVPDGRSPSRSPLSRSTDNKTTVPCQHDESASRTR